MANDATDFSVLQQANIEATNALLDNKNGHLSYAVYHDLVQRLKTYAENSNTSKDWWNKAYLGTFKDIFSHDDNTNETVLNPIFYQWVRQLGLQTYTIMKDAKDNGDVPQIPVPFDLLTPEGYKKAVLFLEGSHQRIRSSLETLQKQQTEQQQIVTSEAGAVEKKKQEEAVTTSTSFLGMSTRQRVELALEQLSKEKPNDLELFLQNNPALKETVENYALAASLTRLGPGEIGGYLDKIQGLRGALSTNSDFLKQFDGYFKKRITFFRLTVAKSGKIRLLSTDDPKLKDQAVEAVATMGKTIGSMPTLRVLTSSPEENRKRIEDKPAESASREELQQYEDDRRAYGIQAALQKQVEGQNRLLRLFGRDQENPYQDNSVFLEEFGMESQTVSSDLTIVDPTQDAVLPSPPAGGVEERPKGLLSRLRSGSQKKDKATEAAQTVKQLQGLSKFVTNPAGIGAGLGVGAGVMAAYSLVQYGVGGLTTLAGAGAGAVIGFAVGGPIGAGIGALVGGAVTLIGGDSSIAASVGRLAANQTVFGGQAAATAKAIGSAASESLPAGLSNATHGALSSGQSLSSAAASGAGSTIKGLNALLTELPKLSIPFTGSFSSTLLVGAPILTATAITTAIVLPSITGSFLISGELGAGATNKYVDITKTASPTNSATPELVTYTLTIKPKGDENNNGTPYSITVTNATDTYQITSKQNPAPSLSNQDVSSLIGNIPPEGKTFQYTVNYADTALGNFNDTRITNTFNITFNVGGNNGGTNQQFGVIASVVFGNPPGDVGCFVFGPAGKSFIANSQQVTSADWNETDKAYIQNAYAITTPFISYQAKLCAAGPITLYRITTSSPYGAWTLSSQSTIIFYNLGLGSVLNTRYTLIHETGHMYAYRNPGDFATFNTGFVESGTGGITTPNSTFQGEPYLRSYTYAARGTAGEDFAESFGMFMVYKNRSFIIGGQAVCINMETEYPKHYSWVKANIFDNIDAPSDPGNTDYCP